MSGNNLLKGMPCCLNKNELHKTMAGNLSKVLACCIDALEKEHGQCLDGLTSLEDWIEAVALIY